MKTLGVHAVNRPTIKSKVVEPADFLIGGLICKTERKYDKAFALRSAKEYQDIYGIDISPSYYGKESADGFFSNTSGVDATLYVSSYVGYTGSAIDSVIASATINNQTPVLKLTLQAGYQAKSGGALEYGISGNRTGYTLENGYRFDTTIKTTGLSTDGFIILNSVADVKVGDTIKIMLTDGGAATVYKVVTAVEESSGKVSFSGTVHATKNPTANDIVYVMGIRLRIWRKNEKGIVSEVDKDIGRIYCALNSLVTDYYIENIFSTSKWLDVTVASTTPASPELDFPIDVSTVTYLTAGADGTTPTTASHWSKALNNLNNLPVRIICNPETTNNTIQGAMEIWAKAREDNPKVVINILQDRTKAQLITIGNNYQRSDDVMGCIVADWVKITDPFSTSDNAQPRIIPNVAFIMGTILRTIGLKGIHYIPQKDTPVYGIIGIDNDNLTNNISDEDRTDIAEAGINIIQFLTGNGYVIRNLFTPSTTLEYKFFNAIMMREYVKVSAKDSLQSSENQPNSFDRILQDRDAVYNFMRRLWNNGSTGAVKLGETFGQGFDNSGKATKFEDHVQVIADLTNNPQSEINAGNRVIDVYFTFPAPAGRIEVGVGLWLR